MADDKEKMELFQEIVEKSKYLVCICERGMLRENGYPDMESEESAYKAEIKYGYSPEEICSSSFFATRKENFFRFYRNEVIEVDIPPNESFFALAELERRGKVKAIITPSWYSLPILAGCQKVIELHGTIYFNICLHCRAEYDIEYIRSSDKLVPMCKKCGSVIRPGVFLYGEIVDNFVMTQAMEEIMKADVILVCGANLQTAFSENYLQHFDGDKLVIINSNKHYSDKRADLVIYNEVKNVLPKLL